MFERLTAVFGGGGSVDTVLTDPRALPGGVLRGEVRLSGGPAGAHVERIDLELVADVDLGARVEPDGVVDLGGPDPARDFGAPDPVGASGPGAPDPRREAVGFGRVTLGPVGRPVGELGAVPFEVAVPWEAPLTVVGGRPLPGVRVGLRTEVRLDGAGARHDLDGVAVHPLPAQDRLLAAFSRLGFRPVTGDLATGTVFGSTLPFHQRIELRADPGGVDDELVVTFLAGPDAVDVLLERDRGGFLSEVADAYDRFTVPYADAGRVDWERWLRPHVRRLTERRTRGGFG